MYFYRVLIFISSYLIIIYIIINNNICEAIKWNQIEIKYLTLIMTSTIKIYNNNNNRINNRIQ